MLVGMPEPVSPSPSVPAPWCRATTGQDCSTGTRSSTSCGGRSSATKASPVASPSWPWRRIPSPASTRPSPGRCARRSACSPRAGWSDASTTRTRRRGSPGMNFWSWPRASGPWTTPSIWPSRFCSRSVNRRSCGPAGGRPPPASASPCRNHERAPNSSRTTPPWPCTWPGRVGGTVYQVYGDWMEEAGVVASRAG